MGNINIISEVKNGNINFAIKEWKRKSIYITKELRDRKYFDKPSVKKRLTKKTAIYNKKRQSEIEDNNE